jgi:hypothetical protein
MDKLRSLEDDRHVQILEETCEIVEEKIEEEVEQVVEQEEAQATSVPDTVKQEASVSLIVSIDVETIEMSAPVKSTILSKRSREPTLECTEEIKVPKIDKI